MWGHDLEREYFGPIFRASHVARPSATRNDDTENVATTDTIMTHEWYDITALYYKVCGIESLKLMI